MNEFPHSNTRILAADDEPQIRELIANFLSRLGITPVLVTNGAECLEILGEQEFDLLILDLIMPEFSGFDVLERVRADPKYDKMLILILSSLVDPEGIKKGFEMGADGYLTKPYLAKNLVSQVRSMLQKGRTVSK